MGSDIFQFPQIALKAGKHPAIVHALDIGLPGGREMLFGVSLPTQRLLRAFASYIGCGNKDLKSKGPPASPGSICGRSAGARDTKTVYALNSGGPGEGPPKPPPCGWQTVPCSHLFFVPWGGRGRGARLSTPGRTRGQPWTWLWCSALGGPSEKFAHPTCTAFRADIYSMWNSIPSNNIQKVLFHLCKNNCIWVYTVSINA